MNKWIYVATIALLSAVLPVTRAVGQEAVPEDSDSRDATAKSLAVAEAPPAVTAPKSEEELVTQLTSGIEEIAGAVDEAVPVIQTEGASIWAAIQQNADEGFLQLSQLTNDVDRVVNQLATELEATLGDIDVAKVSAFLDGFESNIVDFATSAIVDKMTTPLDIAPEKVPAVGDILSADVQKRGRMLDKFLAAGAAEVDSFQGENAELWSETLEHLEGLLTQEQRNTLNQWQAGVDQGINALVAKKKAEAAPKPAPAE